jgi:L-aspartate semialdehyde sulfurtransferase ferredoxin
MSLDVDKKLCDQCGTCISVCPTDALSLMDTILVDNKKCIMCKNCVRVCPVGALLVNQ